MLPVQSPVPLTEGESIGWGISTKHALHFVFGVGASTPIGIVTWIALKASATPGWIAVVPMAVIGVLFAILPVQQRTLAEFSWLTLRFAFRPKVWLYKRDDRVSRHRKGDVRT